MLAKRIIPCLDVKNGRVVKGVQFRNHVDVGDVVELATFYREQGADELVLYDITASAENRTLSVEWVSRVAQALDIPFCVAGGIQSVRDAEVILQAGADKISVNSPALANPALIDDLAARFGSQCVVVGIDSHQDENGLHVYQYTGDVQRTRITARNTLAWISEVIQRGAGEIVLNCMNQDGVQRGYDISQLIAARRVSSVPLIASGGAGALSHFSAVFLQAEVDGALAASVFHNRVLSIIDVKEYLCVQGIVVR